MKPGFRVAFALAVGFVLAESAWAQVPAASAASQNGPSVESCAAEPLALFKLAARRGYLFRAAPTGDATCSLDEGDLNIVVSATASADAICNFELFIPPESKRARILRIGIKAGPGAPTRFVQRSADASKGLRFILEAAKGQTRQFRIVAIDVEPIGNACSEAAIDGALK